MISSNLFIDELEQTSIVRIQKFAKIAGAYGFEVALGFSGGKDSQVCYDLWGASFALKRISHIITRRLSAILS